MHVTHAGRRSRGGPLGWLTSATSSTPTAYPPPAGSARWYPSHVSQLLRTQDARQVAGEKEATQLNV